MSHRHITHVSLDDWKGKTLDLDIGRLMAVVGDSGSGKSGLFELITWLFTGHLGDPKYGGLGRNNDAIADFVGPNGGGGSIHMSDGFGFSRRLARTESGGWTELVNIEGGRHKNASAANAALFAEFGDFFPAFNPNDIINRSAEEFRDFMIQYGASGRPYEADGICRLVILALLYAHKSCGESTVKVTLNRDFGATPETCTMDQINAIVHEQLSERERSAVLELEKIILRHLSAKGAGASEQITAALSAVQDYGATAAKEEKRGREAAAGLMKTMNESPAVPGDIDDLKAKLATLREHEKELVARIAKQKADNAHLATIEKRVSEIETQIAETKAELAKPALAIDMSELSQQRERAEMEVESLIKRHDALKAELGTMEADRSAALKSKHDADVSNERRAAMTEKKSDLDRQIREIRKMVEDEPRSAEELDAEADRVLAGDGRLQEAKAALAAIDKEMTESCAEQSANNKELQAVQARRASLTTDIAILDSKIASLRSNQFFSFVKNDCCAECRTKGEPLIANQSSEIAEYEKTRSAAGETLQLMDTAIDSRLKAQEQHKAAIEIIASRQAQADRVVQDLQREHQGREAKAEGLRSTADWKRKLAEREKEYAVVERQLIALTDTPATALVALIGELDGKIAANKATLATLTTGIESAKSDIATIASRIEDARRQMDEDAKRRAELTALLARLETDLTAEQARRDQVKADSPNLAVDAIERELESVKADLGAAEERVDKKQSYINLLADKEKTLADAEARGTESIVAGMVESAIKQVREHLMNELTGPLKRHMDTFLSGYEPNLSAVVSLERPTGKGSAIFKTGWIRAGQPKPIYYKTMSDEDRAGFVPAVGYAAVKLANPKIAVLLVEASRASSGRIPNLLRALEAVRGDFANIIVSLHHEDIPQDRDFPEWIVRDMNRVVTDRTPALVGSAG